MSIHSRVSHITHHFFGFSLLFTGWLQTWKTWKTWRTQGILIIQHSSRANSGFPSSLNYVIVFEQFNFQFHSGTIELENEYMDVEQLSQ